jgi:hypothetical protein
VFESVFFLGITSHGPRACRDQLGDDLAPIDPDE